MDKTNFVGVSSYDIGLIQVYKKEVKICQKDEALIEIFQFEQGKCTYRLINLSNRLMITLHVFQDEDIY